MDTKSKELLFELLKSHSKLAQAEYNRNPGYNSKHFSHIVELKAIKFLNQNSLFDEFAEYMDKP